MKGNQYKNKWIFKYPAEFRGDLFITLIPKKENKNKPHKYEINWGIWKHNDILNFKNKPITLNFRKISEKKIYPLKFTISPSTKVTTEKRDNFININKGWKCKNKKGLWKLRINKFIQMFLPDTK